MLTPFHTVAGAPVTILTGINHQILRLAILDDRLAVAAGRSNFDISSVVVNMDRYVAVETAEYALNGVNQDWFATPDSNFTSFTFDALGDGKYLAVIEEETAGDFLEYATFTTDSIFFIDHEWSVRLDEGQVVPPKSGVAYVDPVVAVLNPDEFIVGFRRETDDLSFNGTDDDLVFRRFVDGVVVSSVEIPTVGDLDYGTDMFALAGGGAALPFIDEEGLKIAYIGTPTNPDAVTVQFIAPSDDTGYLTSSVAGAQTANGDIVIVSGRYDGVVHIIDADTQTVTGFDLPFGEGLPDTRPWDYDVTALNDGGWAVIAAGGFGSGQNRGQRVEVTLFDGATPRGGPVFLVESEAEALGAQIHTYTDGRLAVGYSLGLQGYMTVLDPRGPILEGTASGDVIYDGETGRTVYGFAGNDEIMALEGDDEVYGGDGDDLVFGGIGSDLIFGGSGNDVLIGDRGDVLSLPDLLEWI